ncbi:MAG TPA: enoyl-CoA hydratase/isomerase family protein [Caulobacteraceae bacterium]|nr:enoyl-CoA hydratase/isomerase family protein [Caulobacteraceae bacterium]
MATTKVKTPVALTRAGRVAVVTIKRGDRLNALSREVMEGLTAIARELRSDTSTSAVVLTGDPVFSAGADLSDRRLGIGADVALIDRREALRVGPDMCAAWEAIDQVTIAAVEAFCIGGAVSLVASCDFRIAGRGAHFRLPEIPLGMNMSWGTQPRLVSLIGPARAKRLVIFGERVHALEAETWGLVDVVADDGGALEIAKEWADKIAGLPPIAVRMAKRAITQIAAANHAAATYMDADQYALAATSEDHREAVAAFFQKRAPHFTGR